MDQRTDQSVPVLVYVTVTSTSTATGLRNAFETGQPFSASFAIAMNLSLSIPSSPSTTTVSFDVMILMPASVLSAVTVHDTECFLALTLFFPIAPPSTTAQQPRRAPDVKHRG